MKNKNILLLFSVFLFMSCFDDKGNYVYTEVSEITIENIPEKIEVLGSVDNIVVTPKITSSLEGEIKADNPNFEFVYKVERKTGGYMGVSPWVVLNPDGELNLNRLAELPAYTYIVWFTVKDLRSGRETSVEFDLMVSSTTYEGWLVLCNEGPENRVRMDMVSKISSDRNVVATDVLTPLGFPESHNAYGIGFYPNYYAFPGDLIYIMTGDRTLKLDRESFATDDSYSIFNMDFIVPPTNEKVINYQTLKRMRANFLVTDVGNAYVQNLGFAGAAFELPINTSVRGGAVEYKVSPYIGLQQGDFGNTALFYDIDNKRFVGWAYGVASNEDGRNILTPVPDPSPAGLFSFKTGKDMVYMEGTRYSNGLVYAVLQDAQGKRSVYGINMYGSGFAQEAYYENLNAPNFDKATHFAFHSQFPFMFYSDGKKVYLHNLGTNTTTEMNVGLGSSDEVTLLKFNLYKNSYLQFLNNQSEEFMAMQYELIVGSYNTAATDNNGGKMTTWKVDGVNSSISKHLEYNGFAKIKDIVYRERR